MLLRRYYKATQFPALTGFDLTLKLRFHGKWTDDYVQILNCCGCHWITVSTIGCANGVINVYDSLYEDVDFDTQKSIRKVFLESNISFTLPKVQKQKGAYDCGLFAIVAICHKIMLQSRSNWSVGCRIQSGCAARTPAWKTHTLQIFHN